MVTEHSMKYRFIIMLEKLSNVVNLADPSLIFKYSESDPALNILCIKFVQQEGFCSKMTYEDCA
jgi:predicted ABC-type ATPase